MPTGFYYQYITILMDV